MTALCAVTAAVTVGSAAPAWAIPAEDTGSTTANVTVDGVITLTGLTAAFTLSGSPGDVVTTTTTPVTMTVTTNNAAGYSVTVEPATATLIGAVPGNTDTIDFAALGVRETTAVNFTTLTLGGPITVGNKTAPSAPEGDLISNDYQATIPFVAPDTYTGTLNYVATAL